MKVNIPVEFKREKKYNLRYQSHVYKIKTMI